MMQNNNLRVLPLGGLGRIGGNLMIYETHSSMIMVDCGILFPGPETPGIDYIMPQLAYVQEHQHKLKAIVLTHAHEDHIGAIPYALKWLQRPDMPIYGTPFTVAMVRSKLSEFANMRPQYETLQERVPVQIGDFHIEPIAVTHSIPQAVMLAITTPIGLVVHTGDFKIDRTPTDQRLTDSERLKELGQQGVQLLLADSTNAERPGRSWSEAEVEQGIRNIITQARYRVFVTTFASHIHRLQSVIDVSEQCGRRVLPVGRSMQQNIAMAVEHGFLRVQPGTLAAVHDYHLLERHQVTIVASGSQGEMMSAMPRIASGQFTGIAIDRGDTVIISSRRIPGNERGISLMLNQLYRLGAEVIDDQTARVHTSGHGYNDEQREVLSWCKPRMFVPVHGELKHMFRHQLLAQQEGVEKNNIYLLEDGFPLDLTKDEQSNVTARIAERVPHQSVLIEKNTWGSHIDTAMRERRALSDVGSVVCSFAYSSGVGVVSDFCFETKGFSCLDEEPNAFFASCSHDLERIAKQLGKKVSKEVLHEEIRVGIRRFIRNALNKRPMITVIIVDVS